MVNHKEQDVLEIMVMKQWRYNLWVRLHENIIQIQSKLSVCISYRKPINWHILFWNCNGACSVYIFAFKSCLVICLSEVVFGSCIACTWNIALFVCQNVSTAYWSAVWHSFQELTVVLSGDFLHHGVGLHLACSHPLSWRCVSRCVTEVTRLAVMWYGDPRDARPGSHWAVSPKKYLLVTSMFFISLFSERNSNPLRAVVF